MYLVMPLSHGILFERGCGLHPPEVVTSANTVCKSALLLALCFQPLLRHFTVMLDHENVTHLLLL